MVKIDLDKLKCIFFDFDGVIADTEWIHYSAFNKILEKYGIKISKKEYMQKYLAYDDKECFKKLFFEKFNKTISKKQATKLILEKTKILMHELKKGFKVYNDTLEFIRYVTSNFPEIKLGIVSGALKNEIKFILKKLSIENKFLFITSAEDVKNGKPSPEPFMKAKSVAENLLQKKLSNKEILVVEDAINGIKSAKKVGFLTLAVGHTYTTKNLKKINPNYVIKNFYDIISKRRV